MDTDNFLEDLELKEREILSKPIRLTLFVLTFLIGVLIMILSYKDMEKWKAATKIKYSFSDYIINNCLLLFVAVPAVSLGLSFIISLIPIPRTTYAKRYPPLAVIIMLVLQMLMFAFTRGLFKLK